MYVAGLPNATVALRDLETLTSVALMRLPRRAAETRRHERLTELHRASTDLCRSLADHTRCALINARGTYGAESLSEETTALFSALTRYAGLVRDIAGEYARFADQPVASMQLLLADAPDARPTDRVYGATPPSDRAQLGIG